MLGVFIIYQMGVKYNIDMGCRIVCHRHSDFAGFYDSQIQTTRIYNPLDIWIHVYTCLSQCKFEYSHILVLMSDVLAFYDKMAY